MIIEALPRSTPLSALGPAGLEFLPCWRVYTLFFGRMTGALRQEIVTKWAVEIECADCCPSWCCSRRSSPRIDKLRTELQKLIVRPDFARSFTDFQTVLH